MGRLVHRLIYIQCDSKSGARLWLLIHCLTEAVIHPLTHLYFCVTLTAHLTCTQICNPSLTHPFTDSQYPPFHVLTDLPHYSFNTPTYCLTYPLIHSVTLIYQLKLICSPPHYYNKSPTNSNIHSPIHSHTHSPINIINDSTYPQTHPIS